MKVLAALFAAVLVGGASAAFDCTLPEPVELPNSPGVLFTHIANPEDGTLTMVLTYPGEAWVGLGVSPTGGMVGSGVVIAKTADAVSAGVNPAKYQLLAQAISGISLLPEEQQTLVDVSVTQDNGETVLTYTRNLEDVGFTTVDPSAETNFVWAVGCSNTFGKHCYRAGFTLPALTRCIELDANGNPIAGQDQGSAVIEATGPPNKKGWFAHGWLMAISWVILVPLAIGSSLLRAWNKSWFRYHQMLNSLSFICVTAAFGIAVSNVEYAGNKHFAVVKHRLIGLIVFILAFVQVLSGIFRPHLPHAPAKDEDAAENGVEPEVPPKSLMRKIFEVEHRLLGTTILGLAWYNCYLGLQQITLFYGVSSVYFSALWGVIGGLSGSILIATLVSKFTKK